MLTLTIATLLAPQASAVWVAPNGHYLRLSDRHTVAFDNQTGPITDLGPSAVTYSCTSGQLSRCGDCVYAHNGQKSKRRDV